MRLAIISDIHGNLTSFEAVLKDIERDGVDQIVCLGDVAAFGPQPRQALARLKSLDCPVVMGNTDAFLLDPVIPPGTDMEALVPRVEWWGAKALLPEDREFIATFQPTVSVDLDGGMPLLAFHGSPRSNTEIILAATPEEDLDSIFSGTGAALLAGGHTHTQLLRRYHDAYLINPGSVGLPQETVRLTGRVRKPPWAEYAVVTAESGGLRIDLRRTPVDASLIIRAIRESGMPFADQLCADWR